MPMVPANRMHHASQESYAKRGLHLPLYNVGYQQAWDAWLQLKPACPYPWPTPAICDPLDPHFGLHARLPRCWFVRLLSDVEILLVKLLWWLFLLCIFGCRALQTQSRHQVQDSDSIGREGRIKEVARREGKGEYEIIIEESVGDCEAVDFVPPGPELIVSEGEFVKAYQPLTSNPNVGGLGQGEVEIVLQDPRQIQGLLAFFASVVLAHIFLVLKKKQFEKV
ncbi:hypothetical protein L7F22_049149 [Adiantum nelumboides]|nr:hypothetical protein [Adiantum nelumboides]